MPSATSRKPVRSPQTLARILKQMSQFLDWCVGEGELRANPWEALKVKDRPEGIRRAVASVLAVMPEDGEFSVRLAASGHRCYCDQTRGVILIHDLVRSASDQPSITKAAGTRARFLGFEYVLLRHQDFLKGHRTFRQKMFARAVKYRMRAGSMAGWFRFCTQHQPVSDVFIYIVPGTLWLGLSKLISRKPQ